MWRRYVKLRMRYAYAKNLFQYYFKISFLLLLAAVAVGDDNVK